MNNEIRIDKKLCQYIPEDSFHPAYWKINMPVTSQYSGYYFQCSDYFCTAYPEFCSIRKGSDNYLYELIHIEREPGKRYKRFRINFDKMNLEFADHSEKFYHNDLPFALAYIKEYANNRTRNAGAVVNKYFAIGHIDKTWFYVSDTERRRLNTSGVRVLKVLDSDEVDLLQSKLQRMYQLKNILYDYKECRIDYKNRYFYNQMEKTLSEAVFAVCRKKLDEINQIITDEATASEQELNEITQYFNSFLVGEDNE